MWAAAVTFTGNGAVTVWGVQCGQNSHNRHSPCAFTQRQTERAIWCSRTPNMLKSTATLLGCRCPHVESPYPLCPHYDPSLPRLSERRLCMIP